MALRPTETRKWATHWERHRRQRNLLLNRMNEVAGGRQRPWSFLTLNSGRNPRKPEWSRNTNLNYICPSPAPQAHPLVEKERTATQPGWLPWGLKRRAVAKISAPYDFRAPRFGLLSLV
jgi:hypothetical protein